MDPLVQTLILKRFRSIPGESVHFDNPTFLVGRNGSGKSNFVDAFDFLAEAMTAPLQAVFDKRGGIAVVRNRTAGSELSRRPRSRRRVWEDQQRGHPKARYAFEVRRTKNYGFEVLREQCVVAWPGESTSSSSTAIKGSSGPMSRGLNLSLILPRWRLPVVAGEARDSRRFCERLAAMHTYAIDPGQLREMQDPDSGLSLQSDGSNVASVLQEIRRQAPEDIHADRGTTRLNYCTQYHACKTHQARQQTLSGIHPGVGRKEGSEFRGFQYVRWDVAFTRAPRQPCSSVPLRRSSSSRNRNSRCTPGLSVRSST